MSLPPNIDPSEIPALEPPPGVVPNFVDPYTRGPMLLALSAVAVGIMYLFVTIRIYCKFFVRKTLSWDDRKSTGGILMFLRYSTYLQPDSDLYTCYCKPSRDFVNHRC